MGDGQGAPTSKKHPNSLSITHTSTESAARTGVLHTPHGNIDTPCFLPVASFGDLRALSFEEAGACGTQIVMVNAWHVYRNAGDEALGKTGGVHKWMNWPNAVFTDSGGYQVFSLRDTSSTSDEGVTFESANGNEPEKLTPEDVIRIQRVVGADIITTLDECAPYPASKKRTRSAMERTSRWARRCVKEFENTTPRYGNEQALWGIVQGGVFEKLRRISIEELVPLDFDGYGIGGLSIGMPHSVAREMTALVCEMLPQDKPRHLLGTGLPCDMLDGIEDGVDTFDCVLPIRKAQRGVAYTRYGEVRYKKNHPGDLADTPLDPECRCPACKNFSREQLRLLYRTEKTTASRLVAIHNLSFYHEVFNQARAAIRLDKFSVYKKAFSAKWSGEETGQF